MDTSTTKFYTLSLHDALPISHALRATNVPHVQGVDHNTFVHSRVASNSACVSGIRASGCLTIACAGTRQSGREDRKSTRLNSSHSQISYAVFCLKKKKYTRSR